MLFLTRKENLTQFEGDFQKRKFLGKLNDWRPEIKVSIATQLNSVYEANPKVGEEKNKY